MKTGVLLINLGTPDAATIPAVRRYLREFLSDPYVIDIAPIARWVLLNTVILPFRTKQTTKAYQQIWTEQGSPLLMNSKNLTEKLRITLGDNYCVALAMRYGNPTIESAVETLLSQNIGNMLVIPLYPHYAESTTKSSIQKAEKIIRSQDPNIPIKFLSHFHQHNDYIQAKAKQIKATLVDKKIDQLIFSYHGLPERHIQRVCSEKTACDLKKPCPNINNKNDKCYRAQCYATSRHIAKQLNLEPNAYRVTFQSRLGRIPWITPYTDHTLQQLANDGMKNIAIVCPSFVADCLETLEEIDIRAKKQWHKLGGQNLIRIPCLNDDDTWIQGLANMIQQ